MECDIAIRPGAMTVDIAMAGSNVIATRSGIIIGVCASAADLRAKRAGKVASPIGSAVSKSEAHWTINIAIAAAAMINVAAQPSNVTDNGAVNLPIRS